MKIVLSREGCIQNNISLDEVLLLLFLFYSGENLEAVKDLLIKKGLITAVGEDLGPNKVRVTREGANKLDFVILDSDTYTRSDNELLSLAEKLKEIFPPGKKEGTSNYWAEGKALIAKRLKGFFKKYGSNFTDEQILTAAEKYVESFNGDYQFMRTLKYFIFKDKIVAGEIEYTSELLSYIENAGQEDSLSNNWNTELV